MRRSSLSLVAAAIFLFTLPGPLLAQSGAKLSGTVSDSSKPLALVTVRLLKKNNATPLQTALSKENGSFQLSKPASGNYTLSFTHTGFAEKQVKVTVGAQTGDMSIDPVQLSRVIGTLKEVVVSSKRPLVEQSDDKIVFNVEDDPAAKTETAIDILRKTPFVTVDGEDNIMVNGKTNFKVLLNGKETSMFANNVKEALRGFPGVLISKIEVITIPSAKYDGEGIGGLINIITKKKVMGYNGTLSSFSRTSDKLNNFSVNGNGKMGHVGLSMFLNSGFSDPVNQHNTNITIPAIPDAYAKRTLDGEQATSGRWTFGNAELSWDVDTLNTLSIYTNINGYSNKTVTGQTITTDFTSSPSTIGYYNLDNNVSNPGVSVGSDYTKHFSNNKEREHSLRFLGEFGKNDADLSSSEGIPGAERYLNNNSKAINDQYTIQEDNIIPVNSTSKFEGGLKAILRRASSNYQSLLKYNAADNYELDPANTDYFKYAQDVYSLYSMYSFRTKKSTLRFGARVEFTNVNGDFTSSKTKVNSRYTTILPNVVFTNHLSKVTTLVFAYTKRLQRPSIGDLNPFVNNNDSLNISYGNPNLGPQTAHSLSGQVRFASGNTFAGINLDGSYSDNKILQYTSFDPQTGIRSTTSLNIGKEITSGLNLNLSTKITPNWSLFVNGSLRYATVTNNTDASQSNRGFGYNFNLNMIYKFTSKFNMSTYLGLWKNPQTIQTTYPFSAWNNIALNYKILNEKVSISLRVVNGYEKTHDYTTVTKDVDFYNTNTTTQIRRGGVLALTWNFGKLTENVSKKKGVNNDDMLTKPVTPTNN